MATLLGLVGVANVEGDAVHVQVVGETDAGRLLVQRVGRQEPVTVIERVAFVEELALAPEPLSDEVRSAALDLSQAIERAKAMAGTDHLLDQEDFQILHDELEETDQYPFAAALIEHGVHVRTGAVDVMTDPHGEVDGLANHPEPWSSPGGAGEVRGVGEDPPDAPGSFPWTPADSGDGISNESATSEHDYPWPRKVEGRVKQAQSRRPIVCQMCGELYDAPGAIPGLCPACTEYDYPFNEDAARKGQANTCPSCGAPKIDVTFPCKSCGKGGANPDDEHEAEFGWSGTELVDERWAHRRQADQSFVDLFGQPVTSIPSEDLLRAIKTIRKRVTDRYEAHELVREVERELDGRGVMVPPELHFGGGIVASVSMMDIAKHPLGRPKHDLEKDSDANTPSGRDRGLNPSVHEEIGEAYQSQNQWEDPDLHLGRSMRNLVAMEGQPYQTNVPVAEGEGEGVHDEVDLDESTIQPHASRTAQVDDGIGIAGDAYEDPGAGEPLDSHDEDAPPDPKDFGVMASRSMRGIIAQGVDNRLSDPDVRVNVDEQENDRAIPRPPEDEDLRY